MVLVQACPEYKKNIKKFSLQMSHTSRWNRPYGRREIFFIFMWWILVNFLSPEQVFKMVTMAGMSKGVVDLIVDLAYGLDRFYLIHKFCPIYLVG